MQHQNDTKLSLDLRHKSNQKCFKTTALKSKILVLQVSTAFQVYEAVRT